MKHRSNTHWQCWQMVCLVKRWQSTPTFQLRKSGHWPKRNLPNKKISRLEMLLFPIGFFYACFMVASKRIAAVAAQGKCSFPWDGIGLAHKRQLRFHRAVCKTAIFTQRGPQKSIEDDFLGKRRNYGVNEHLCFCTDANDTQQVTTRCIIAPYYNRVGTGYGSQPYSIPTRT